MRRFASNSLSSAVGLSLLYLLVACGTEAKFHGGAPPKPPVLSKRTDPAAGGTTIADPGSSDATDGGTTGPGGGTSGGTTPGGTTPGGTTNLTSNYLWHWSCPTAPVAAPTPGQDTVLIQGPTHTIRMGQDATLNLNVGGNLCLPTSEGRDIVFVVDVSESMRDQYNIGADPISGSSCGRLDAVRMVVASQASNTSSRFGLVTFSDDVMVSSSALLTATDFNSQYATLNNLCRGYFGTNYTVGLNAADVMLNGPSSRARAHKEVYFMTDGLPLTVEGNGEITATRIKQYGGIGVVMLGGDNQAARLRIASVGKNNQPLYFQANQASQMASALLEMSGVKVDTASFKFGLKGGTALEERAIVDLDNLTFSYPNLSVDRKKYPAGFVVTFSYRDTHGVTYQQTGTMLWAD